MFSNRLETVLAANGVRAPARVRVEQSRWGGWGAFRGQGHICVVAVFLCVCVPACHLATFTVMSANKMISNLEDIRI